MSVTFRIPTILRAYTAGASEVSITPTGSTVCDAFEALESSYPGIRARVLDEQGKLRRFVNVYVDEDDVRFSGGLAAPTPQNARISIIPAVAGG